MQRWCGNLLPEQMQKELGTNGGKLVGQGGQDFYWLLIGTDDDVEESDLPQYVRFLPGWLRRTTSLRLNGKKAGASAGR